MAGRGRLRDSARHAKPGQRVLLGAVDAAEVAPCLHANPARSYYKWFAVLEPLKGNISAAIDKVVTTHRELFRDYVGPKAVTLLRDDDLVTRAAENIYPVLPFAIRIVVKEDVFTAFLSKHRGPLIAALQKA